MICILSPRLITNWLGHIERKLNGLIKVKRLETINVCGGDVLKVIEHNQLDSFGEVYFSEIQGGFVKAWKKHSQMTLRLVVPAGMVRFVFFDSEGKKKLHDETIGRENYSLITVLPNIWFGFKGIGYGTNLVMNIADIMHEPDEVERLGIEDIAFDWSGS